MISLCYILGTTRSGTSALRNALAKTKYKGHGEGHLVPLLTDILAVVRKQKTSGLGADTAGNSLFEMNESLLNRFLFFGYEEYLKTLHQSDFIVDKTPTIAPIDFAPLLNKFHSSPKFVYCSRRHIDNIISKRKKFPETPFAVHCREWADCSLSWQKQKLEINGNYIEFDYFDLLNDIIAIGDRMANYLGLSEEERNIFTHYLRLQRPEGSMDIDLGSFTFFSDVDWAEQEKMEFMRVCEPVGQQLGYGLESYFEEPNP